LNSATGDDDKGDVIMPMTQALRESLAVVVQDLARYLPAYMVPTFFVPLRYMPFQTSMKLDRSELRKIANSFTHEEMLAYSLADGEKVAPATELEVKMQKVWAQVLHVKPEQIGRHDNFLQIGGDSISAIQVVTMARQANLKFTVQDIFSDPRLSAVSLRAVEGQDMDIYRVPPFSLLPAGEVDKVRAAIALECGLQSSEEIEDAYPCTSLQEGLMALAVKQPGSYIAKHVYRLADHVDADRFRTAWERTLAASDSLRSRIVLHGGATFQGVIREPASWESTEGASLTTELGMASKTEMQYGSRLCRYALVLEETGARYFVLVMHHAVFDGWSIGLVLGTLSSLYDGGPAPSLEAYAGFASYTSQIDPEKARDYWMAQLDGAQPAAFPRGDTTTAARKSTTRILQKTIAFPKAAESFASITKATVFRAAWALVLARYCDTDDVCFGTTVSGRQAPVPGIETMAGPTVATVPVRLRLNRQQSVAGFLHDVQAHAFEMVAYEQFGLQNIAKLSADAKEACNFGSLMVIQPTKLVASMDGKTEFLRAADSAVYNLEDSLNGYFSYPLVMQAVPHDHRVDLMLTYNTNAVSASRLEAMSQHLEHVLEQLLTQPERTLSAVSLASHWDVGQAIERKGDTPEIIDSCVHWLIEAQARHRPDALAIRAWNGELTYCQLDAAASRLGRRLVSNAAVHCGDLVHVCFEKSAWFFVAILAINKAGAAWGASGS
jgi:aryl carrier-like protein